MFSSIGSCIGCSLLALAGLFLSGMAGAPTARDPDSWRSIVLSGRFQMTIPLSWVPTVYDLPGAGHEMIIIKDPADDAREIQVISVLNEEGRVCDEVLLEEVSRSFMDGAEYTPLQGVSPNYNAQVHSLIYACTDKDGRMVMMVTKEVGPYIVFVIGTYFTPEAVSGGANELGVMAGSLIYIL